MLPSARGVPNHPASPPPSPLRPFAPSLFNHIRAEAGFTTKGPRVQRRATPFGHPVRPTFAPSPLRCSTTSEQRRIHNKGTKGAKRSNALRPSGPSPLRPFAPLLFNHVRTETVQQQRDQGCKEEQRPSTIRSVPPSPLCPFVVQPRATTGARAPGLISRSLPDTSLPAFRRHHVSSHRSHHRHALPQ